MFKGCATKLHDGINFSKLQQLAGSTCSRWIIGQRLDSGKPWFYSSIHEIRPPKALPTTLKTKWKEVIEPPQQSNASQRDYQNQKKRTVMWPCRKTTCKMIKDRLLDIGPFLSAKPDFASVRFLQLHSREFNNLLFLYRRSQYCTTTLGDCNVVASKNVLLPKTKQHKYAATHFSGRQWKRSKANI